MRLWLKRPKWWVKVLLHDLHLKEPAGFWVSFDEDLLFLRALFIFASSILACSYFFAPRLTLLRQEVRLAAVFSQESGSIPKSSIPASSVSLNLFFCLQRDLFPSASSQYSSCLGSLLSSIRTTCPAQRSWFFLRRVGTLGNLVRSRTSVSGICSCHLM